MVNCSLDFGQPASSLIYSERTVAHSNVLPPPWDVPALQDSGPVFSLEFTHSLCPSNQPSTSLLRSAGTPPSSSSLWFRCTSRDFTSTLWWFMTLPKAVRYCLGIKHLDRCWGLWQLGTLSRPLGLLWLQAWGWGGRHLGPILSPPTLKSFLSLQVADLTDLAQLVESCKSTVVWMLEALQGLSDQTLTEYLGITGQCPRAQMQGSQFSGGSSLFRQASGTYWLVLTMVGSPYGLRRQ